MYTFLQGGCLEQLKTLEDKTIQTCVTSPPYFGLRDYDVDGQIGLEQTPEEYVEKLVQVFREVRRVLKDDGTLWLNLGDSYAGGGNYRGVNSEATLTSKQRSNRGARGVSQLLCAKNTPNQKPKDLIGIPWSVAFALRADGWYLRSDIIWHKPNPMPESVTDRPTKAHEYIFLMSKSPKYFYDAEAVKEPQVGKPHAPGNKTDNGRLTSSTGHLEEPTRIWAADGKRNRRTVWTVSTKPYKGAHFATFPPDLIKPCILAGSAVGDTVLDPFNGSGTTGQVSVKHGRNYIGIELNPEYIELSKKRLESA